MRWISSRGNTDGTSPQHDGGVTETEDASLPLAGFTVAVTAARRKEELGALLDRRGARVIYAPAIRIVPLSDDAELVAATREVLAAPVDLVVATTGVGFRGWLEAPAALRLARGLERDGAVLESEWRAWQRTEAAEFAREDTRTRADLRVDGAAPSPEGTFVALD